MAGFYRADHVGSLLRPQVVKEARSAYLAGRMKLSELTAVEDRAILSALQRQRDVGAQVFTDGEFRRAIFQSDLVDSVDGFVDTGAPAVVRIWQGPGDQPTEPGTMQVVGARLRRRKGLTENQLPFLKEHAQGPVKMTLPSLPTSSRLLFSSRELPTSSTPRVRSCFGTSPALSARRSRRLPKPVSTTFRWTRQGTATTLTPAGGSTCANSVKIPTRCSRRLWPPTTTASRERSATA